MNNFENIKNEMDSLDVSTLDINTVQSRYIHLLERCKSLSRYKARAKQSYHSLQLAYTSISRQLSKIVNDHNQLKKENWLLRGELEFLQYELRKIKEPVIIKRKYFKFF